MSARQVPIDRTVSRCIGSPWCRNKHSVRFGSAAASQQFITWAAGYGQKRTLVIWLADTFVAPKRRANRLNDTLYHVLANPFPPVFLIHRDVTNVVYEILLNELSVN